MDYLPLTKELHASCKHFADEQFAENLDALLSQIDLARKPVCAFVDPHLDAVSPAPQYEARESAIFVVPRLDSESQKSVLKSLFAARIIATIVPAQILHEDAYILYTKVEIIC